MGNLSMFYSTPYFFLIVLMHIFLNEVCCENFYCPCIGKKIIFIYNRYLNILGRLRRCGKMYQKHNGCMFRFINQTLNSWGRINQNCCDCEFWCDFQTIQWIPYESHKREAPCLAHFWSQNNIQHDKDMWKQT